MKEGFWALFWMESGRGHTVREETYVFLKYEDGYSEKDEENLRSLVHDWCQYDKQGCDRDRYKYGFDIVSKPPNDWLEKELKKLRCKSEEIVRQENLIKSELGINDRRIDHTKVMVLTQMGIEIPESIYDEFLEHLDRDGWIDVPATAMNDKHEINNIKIRIFKAEGQN